MPRGAMLKISGWGNYPVEECRVFRPEKPADLPAILTDRAASGDFISRGLGRSYGDAALNPNSVILHTRLNRF